MQMRFGPSGNSESFFAEGHKTTIEQPKWLHENFALDAFEYSFGRGVRITEKSARQIGEAFDAYGIQKSVHAPYFINLATEEFMKGIRKLCDEEGILMICDEVQCGMGRTGSMFTWQSYGIRPDIMSMAKAIGKQKANEVSSRLTNPNMSFDKAVEMLSVLGYEVVIQERRPGARRAEQSVIDQKEG